MYFMYRIDQTHFSQIEMKHSKFMAFLVPIGDFDRLHERLKGEHPKASHIVWAKRYLNVHEQVVEDSSDDGEPKGCAGKPVLRVMQGADLIECGILVVRYFGGIKLGTGGMVRAYGEAAKAVIESAECFPYEKEATVTFFTPYADVSRWEYLIGQNEGIEIEKEFDEKGCHWKITAPMTTIERLKELLSKRRIEFR